MTSVKSMIPMLDREVNPPGGALYPTATGAQKMGYLLDGFWDARLAGTLSSWTVVDGNDLATPVAGDYFITDANETEDLPEQFQMMVVIFAGARMIRLKILNLAVNFTAEAGSLSYEQQASATTLRAVLATLQKDLAELKTMYSDSFSPGAMAYMDGTLQRAASLAYGYMPLQIA